MGANAKLVARGDLSQRIFVIGGRRVMLDADLARLYGVTTKRLNEQVKRNRSRFPDDFAFRLSPAETRRYEQHDRRFKQVFQAIRELMVPEVPGARRIGFRSDDEA